MGKSVTSTLMGMLIKQGEYHLWQPAPVPEWQGADDPRAKIRIADMLHMSSGLRIRAPQDPDYDPSAHIPIMCTCTRAGVNAFRYAATRPLQWLPGTVGRYRNTDPVLDQLPRAPGGREARGRVPVVSAARALRQDRHADDGDGNGRVSETFSRRGTSLHRRATGRASAISFFRTECGTASGFCPKGTSSS